MASKTTEPGVRARRRAELLAQLVVSRRASDEVSGAPRILADLRDAGVQVSRKTVSKLMPHNGIRGISPRPWQPVTTAQDVHVHTILDRVGRRFDQSGLNMVWTWLYLCAVRDGHSRRVIGYAAGMGLTSLPPRRHRTQPAESGRGR
ncbi:IS3 family transposase [Nakamurella sp. YIM 132087]|uniref:IS3 family transposase n=1 Tax=Nakamurella alba TaxID=2665158 RepID=A0A7K1FPE7_9ACTN|nr:IS3 family transposase [Nakamurella alba]